MKRNDVVIPFNKDRMVLKDMDRAVRALESIVNRWHEVEAKRKAEEEAKGVVEDYESMTDEFFWDVGTEIIQFTTWKLEEDKNND